MTLVGGPSSKWHVTRGPAVAEAYIVVGAGFAALTATGVHPAFMGAYSSGRSGDAFADELEAEQAAFVHSCLTGSPAVVDGRAGRAALDAALRVEAAIGASLAAAGLPSGAV